LILAKKLSFVKIMLQANPNTTPPESARALDFSLLRDLRKREGLTLTAVSERSGVSPAVISKLERNQTSAELETLYRLARVFGLNATDLISLAESRTAQRANAKHYTSRNFDFNRIDYANAQCFHANAPAGSDVSRPDVHGDDFEICWVLKGCLRIGLPHETHVLNSGEALQFDAIQEHTYEALKDTELLIIHLRKDKRF
jgi:transcriptional regulator with XRE-family HTH domain